MADLNKAENAKKGSGIGKFLSETKAEMKKVTWPSKEQLINNTGVIITFIIVACIVLSLLDFGFQQIMQLLQKL